MRDKPLKRGGPDESEFIPFAYRPFDNRWLYWERDTKQRASEKPGPSSRTERQSDISPLAKTLVVQRLQQAAAEDAPFKGGLPDIIASPCLVFRGSGVMGYNFCWIRGSGSSERSQATSTRSSPM